MVRRLRNQFWGPTKQAFGHIPRHARMTTGVYLYIVKKNSSLVTSQICMALSSYIVSSTEGRRYMKNPMHGNRVYRVDCRWHHSLSVSVLGCESRGHSSNPQHGIGLHLGGYFCFQRSYLMRMIMHWMHTVGGKIRRRRRELVSGHPSSYAEAKQN